ncbi:hypothetical protein SAMN05660649_00800 [Desulfotomaculum arcticum]|uniref:Uncharacterized protein n=2 Tax=Desulfotruncus TaxID=2867377 RepID=A0A1I2PA98_9FIRM|nr:hypothetical protein SAMN05660649_00800 [Desulfotomaculum arcticum] [Desulfotruncus arcticus DSM 17038]
MKKWFVLMILTVTLAICVSGCSTLTKKSFANNEAVQYTLYIGLNDKDTYQQKIPTGEAEKKVNAIALKYVDGFTEFSGKGVYKDDKGVVTYENNLIYIFNSATDEQMKSIMGEVLKELDQNAVLIEKQKVGYEFYGGKNS